jgi:hypothetical protein
MPKQINKNGIYPSQVFFARTVDPFTKKRKIHPFVVWYSQEVDSNTELNNNVYALRITTTTGNSSHLVKVNLNKMASLKEDSYIICDDVVLFDKKDINVVGRVDFVTWLNVIKERQKKFNEEMIQNVIAFSNIKYFR